MNNQNYDYNSKINQIIIDATNMHDKNPNLRFGQCIFNSTLDVYPAMIWHTSIAVDCFYANDKVEAFLNVVREYEKSISKIRK